MLFFRTGKFRRENFQVYLNETKRFGYFFIEEFLGIERAGRLLWLFWGSCSPNIPSK